MYDFVATFGFASLTFLSQEYSSVLERYFHFNAYPSSADRTALARKTQMSCRQIEVWVRERTYPVSFSDYF